MCIYESKPILVAPIVSTLFLFRYGINARLALLQARARHYCSAFNLYHLDARCNICCLFHNVIVKLFFVNSVVAVLVYHYLLCLATHAHNVQAALQAIQAAALQVVHLGGAIVLGSLYTTDARHAVLVVNADGEFVGT